MWISTWILFLALFFNTDQSIKIINEILAPYFESQRKELGLDGGFPALLVPDVFQGQISNEVTSLLGEKDILIVKVPNNMKHLLQLLDLSVNGLVKRWMRQRFPELIQTGLHNGLQLERIEVKMPRTIMKPFYDRWLIELNNTMTTDQGKGKEAIISG